MVTGRLATARSRRSAGRRLFLARTAAYSSTSANVVSAASISSISSVFPRINLARPPSTAASRTLASAASFTTALPPTLKVCQDFLLRNPAALDLASDLAAQHGKQFVFQFPRQGILL